MSADVSSVPPPRTEDGATGNPATEDLATEDLAETIARTLIAHPSVARLGAGRFGEVATALPGRRVVGVRTGAPGDTVEVAVVLWLIEPIPVLVAELRALVHTVAGREPVDVQVVDVLTDTDMAARGETDTSGAEPE
jgi:hypothetical protein